MSFTCLTIRFPVYIYCIWWKIISWNFDNTTTIFFIINWMKAPTKDIRVYGCISYWKVVKITWRTICWNHCYLANIIIINSRRIGKNIQGITIFEIGIKITQIQNGINTLEWSDSDNSKRWWDTNLKIFWFRNIFNTLRKLNIFSKDIEGLTNTFETESRLFVQMIGLRCGVQQVLMNHALS